MDRAKCIDFMLGSGKVGKQKYTVKRDNQAESQLNHLIKYKERDNKRLARETNLPEVMVRRFKQFIRSNGI